jgi:hypothetical protein
MTSANFRPVPSNQQPVLELRTGDRLQLRKPHPCGGSAWRVVRLGADIGLVCETCGHKVMVDRRRIEQRLVTFIERGPVA